MGKQLGSVADETKPCVPWEAQECDTWLHNKLKREVQKLRARISKLEAMSDRTTTIDSEMLTSEDEEEALIFVN